MFQTRGSRKTLAIRVRRCWQLYLFLLLPGAYRIAVSYTHLDVYKRQSWS